MVHILLVEDEPHIRHLIGSVLKQLGYHVTKADDGLTALGILKKSSPDLVLTDLNMPQMDGLQLIEMLNAEKPGLPVIAISAFPDKRVEAEQKGVRHFLAKPFAYKQLIDIVESALPIA